MNCMIKITPLVENKSKFDNLLSEHGLSLLIECDDKRILFDTGASDLMLNNAMKMSIDLNNIDCVVLSHGHYDHTGGLQYINNKKIYAHPDIFIPKYKAVNDQYEYDGLSHNEEHYAAVNNLEFIQVKQGMELTKNITLHADFTKQATKDFYLQTSTGYVPDVFTDELVLSINTDNGLIIVSGCAHSGIVNIIDKVIQDTGNNQIYAILGGFHLYDLTYEEVQRVADIMNNYNIKHIGISHCTGDKLSKCLSKSNIFAFNIGDQFIVKS